MSWGNRCLPILLCILTQQVITCVNTAKVTIGHCTLKVHLILRPQNVGTVQVSFRDGDTKNYSPFARTGKLRNTQVVDTAAAQ